jgi:sugar O-acyltransferase (sialic acid O-acetyltransferase NeuD family)
MNAKTSIVIIGSSGHASVIVEIIESANEYSILGYIDDFAEAHEVKSGGYKVLGNGDELTRMIKIGLVENAVIAIGDNVQRELVFEKISSANSALKFPTLIHKDAFLSKNFSVGNGTVIMRGVSVNPNAHIGEFCIINTGSIIEHDCYIDNFASVAPGVTMGGNVWVGRSAIISIGVTIIHKIKIGSHALVAAGAVVVKHVQDNALVIGVPAKFIRSRNKGEKYL